MLRVRSLRDRHAESASCDLAGRKHPHRENILRRSWNRAMRVRLLRFHRVPSRPLRTAAPDARPRDTDGIESFDPAEHGGICAIPRSDTELQGRKPWAAEQLPKTVTQVLSKVIQDASARAAGTAVRSA